MIFSKSRLKEIIRHIKNKRIMIIGDIMIDEYLRGRVTRLSPEAPVPIVSIDHEEIRLGGAANVALNVKTLGADPLLVGVVGADSMVSKFESLMGDSGMDTSGIIRDSARPTTLKTRIIGDNQHIARVDKEHADPVSQDVLNQLLDHVTSNIGHVDAVILEDYNKGILAPELITKVLDLAAKNNTIVAVDPKFVNFMSYSGATVFKPNIKEVSAALAREIRTVGDVEEAGLELLSRLNVDCVLLTRGSNGISIFEAGGLIIHIPTKAKKVADVSGAGDTVIATMTVALCGNASFVEAASLSNIAAGIVCEEVGIVPVYLDDLESEALKS